MLSASRVGGARWLWGAEVGAVAGAGFVCLAGPQPCCYSTHKPNTISYNSVPALLLLDTQIQHPQLQLNSSSAVIRHTNPTQFQEADCTPGLCYTTHKPNSVSYNSTPESRKQTASQACVIQHTKPTLSATTQFQESDSTPRLCYTAHKANIVCYNSIPGSRLHSRTVLYSTQSQHCLLQLNSRKQTAPQACVIQHTKPTLSATTQFCCNSIPGSRLHPRLVLYSTQSHHCLL